MATFKDTSTMTISAIIIVFGLFTLTSGADPNTDTHLVLKICNGIKYDRHSPISSSIDYVLDDILRNTASNGYNYYSKSPVETDVAYGHGACNGQISAYGCGSCMQEAYLKLVYGCPENTGAQVKLRDCRARYEIYPFTD